MQKSLYHQQVGKQRKTTFSGNFANLFCCWLASAEEDTLLLDLSACAIKASLCCNISTDQRGCWGDTPIERWYSATSVQRLTEQDPHREGRAVDSMEGGAESLKREEKSLPHIIILCLADLVGVLVTECDWPLKKPHNCPEELEGGKPLGVVLSCLLVLLVSVEKRWKLLRLQAEWVQCGDQTVMEGTQLCRTTKEF